MLDGDVVVILASSLSAIILAVAFMVRMQAKVIEELSSSLSTGLKEFTHTLGEKMDKLSYNISDLKMALIEVQRDLNSSITRIDSYKSEIEYIRNKLESIERKIEDK